MTSTVMQLSGAAVPPFCLFGGFNPITAFHVTPIWTKCPFEQPSRIADIRPLCYHRTGKVESGALPRRERCFNGLRASNEVEPSVRGTSEALEALTRRELQALCKTLKLRAVGKTEDLRKRLTETLRQSERESISTVTLSPDTNDANALRDPSYRWSGSRSVDDAGTAIYSNDAPEFLDRDVDVEVGHDVYPVEGLDGRSSATRVSEPSTGFGNTKRKLPISLDRLSQEQREQITELSQLLTEWNEKINLVSRKDIGNVYHRHLLPCVEMALALDIEDGMTEQPPSMYHLKHRHVHMTRVSFRETMAQALPQTMVLDMGTGGGLPGLPLAICCPNVLFTLIDGTGKKIMAVNDMVKRLGLTNVRALHVRVEDVYDTFDYVVGRAVCSLPKFIQLVEKNIRRNDASGGARRAPAGLKRGVLYMRGATTLEELAELGTHPAAIVPLDTLSRAEGDEDSQDRGYSSVLHFVSEDIFRRSPADVDES